MKTKNLTKMALAFVTALLLIPGASAQNSNETPQCQLISGTVMTNLAVVDQNTTLGVVDGDLKGAVAATILNVVPGPEGTVIFTVQHHFVTQEGDTIYTAHATATTREAAPGLYALLNYLVHITGGTGKFAGATGDFNNIGAADLNTGRTVFRYAGKVCFAAPSND